MRGQKKDLQKSAPKDFDLEHRLLELQLNKKLKKSTAKKKNVLRSLDYGGGASLWSSGRGNDRVYRQVHILKQVVDLDLGQKSIHTST